MVVLAPEESQMSCERLEYGKFTDGRGTVDGGEHRTLALSSQFPESLKRFCAPRILGPVRGENDSRPPWAPRGVVLQPVRTEQGVLPVLACVCELSERRTARNYQ